MEVQISDSVENIVGKGEIARYEQFLLFPQCFKSCMFLMRQNEYLWSKGLTHIDSFRECLLKILWKKDTFENIVEKG